MSHVHAFLAELSAAFGAPDLLEPEEGILTFEVDPDCAIFLQLDPATQSVLQLCCLGTFEHVAEADLQAALAWNRPGATASGFTFGREPQSGSVSLSAREFLGGFTAQVALGRLADMARIAQAWRHRLSCHGSGDPLPHLPPSDEAAGAVDFTALEEAFQAARHCAATAGAAILPRGPESFAFALGACTFTCTRQRDSLCLAASASVADGSPETDGLCEALLLRAFCLAGLHGSGVFRDGSGRIGFCCTLRPGETFLEEFKQACVLTASDLSRLAGPETDEKQPPDTGPLLTAVRV